MPGAPAACVRTGVGCKRMRRTRGCWSTKASSCPCRCGVRLACGTLEESVAKCAEQRELGVGEEVPIAFRRRSLKEFYQVGAAATRIGEPMQGSLQREAAAIRGAPQVDGFDRADFSASARGGRFVVTRFVIEPKARLVLGPIHLSANVLCPIGCELNDQLTEISSSHHGGFRGLKQYGGRTVGFGPFRAAEGDLSEADF